MTLKYYCITGCLLGPWLSCFTAPELKDRCVWARDVISPENSNEAANQAQQRDRQHAVRCANGSHWSVCVLAFLRRCIQIHQTPYRDTEGWSGFKYGMRLAFPVSEIAWWKWPHFRPCSPRKQAIPPLGFFLYCRGLITNPTRWNLLILCPLFQTKALPNSENVPLLLIHNNTRCSDGRANDYFILREMFS